ncbi:unnamed protein product [Rotaria socialis]|uniref:C3H1-type domain-containing protein n=1 Tax=Rotaria socialis TaxID=392032 RepID=A0A821RID2_9BILA|nr:unnamed protein product [Rotaria socialis]CAF4839358.1 unnamed protein product [Rotaria socialis]
MASSTERKPCRYGGRCLDIDEKRHVQEFDHPPYCPDGGHCQNTTEDHEKEYRHVSMCPDLNQCTHFQSKNKTHCTQYRHCQPKCKHGSNCANFHDKDHIKRYKHPFPQPCPLSPYHCELYNKSLKPAEYGESSRDVEQHCREFAHICHFGRSCKLESPLHLEKSIHVPRLLCTFGTECARLLQEEHLNMFTHSDIRDIRILCKHADKCHSRRDPKHVVKFRHAMALQDSGIVPFYHLNKNIDFEQNQSNNIAYINNYVERENWEPLPSGSIPQEIIEWLRTVQPVHRCNPEIFKSILIHGHVMSREYMEALKDPGFTANSILHHSRIRRIDALKVPIYAESAKKYITALVAEEYEKNGFLKMHSNENAEETQFLSSDNSISTSRSDFINKECVYLSHNISSDDMNTIHKKTTEIAQASMKLKLNPTGIGYDRDKQLGTNKHVFSILGPHLGHNYGDVFIVFKREILHHPDANFSLQAATSFVSGRTYKWRPWLGIAPESIEERIKLYHDSKLHASIPDYERASALELIATVSYFLQKKTMNIDLKTIIECWLQLDSHRAIEAHLPQLIPLSYIDHIYVAQNIFEWLDSDDDTRRAMNAVFKDRITITPHQGEIGTAESKFGPKPSSALRAEYQDFVIKELIERFGKHETALHSTFLQGCAITIPSSNFKDNFILPLTISQFHAEQRLAEMSKNMTIYIYWQMMNGDMMLTLSNEQINSAERQPNLRCLICYVAPKPRYRDSNYHEQPSYLNFGLPSQHHTFIHEDKYAAKSTVFYVGCNTDDFMTCCLEIQCSTNTITLSHAGPNAIYNHERISHSFAKSDLDLNALKFIHVSAGIQTVPIRNMIVCKEKKFYLHMSYDKNFSRSSGLPVTTLPNRKSNFFEYFTRMILHTKNVEDETKKSSFNKAYDPVRASCPKSIDCPIQFSNDGKDHNSKFSHPCRFAELCRDPEAHLTHETRQVTTCELDKKCQSLCDPIHRALYRHTDLPYFLIPCKFQATCTDVSDKHCIKYSHGQRVLEEIQATVSKSEQEFICRHTFI